MNETSTENAALTAKLKELTAKYCRREITYPQGLRLCMKTIKTANALGWCNDCRAEKLPMWPADDAHPTQTQEVH